MNYFYAICYVPVQEEGIIVLKTKLLRESTKKTNFTHLCKMTSEVFFLFSLYFLCFVT